MPDITKCLNDKCEDRKICYRACATDSKNQSYVYFKPDSKTKLCKHYLPIYDPF